MSFLVDINPDMKLPAYDLVLCKLNEEPVMTIQNIEDFQYDGNFASIHEMSFRIPLYRSDSDGTKIVNERYHAIEGDMLILLNNMKFFYIHYAKEIVAENGAAYKEVQAYSREYELSQKQISGYSGVSRAIYVDPVLGVDTPLDENGLEIGFFNYVERVCSWRVGYIDPDLLEVKRQLDCNNTNLLQAFQDVQRAFGCIFLFDTFNKTIDIEKIENLGVDQGLHISDKNFLQTLEKTIKSDEIKTRLYLYGKDNISIQRLNITGQAYIENYDFYKNTKYMSQGLIDALDNYDDYVLNRKPAFTSLIVDLDAYTVAVAPELVALSLLETELSTIQTELDIVISTKYATQEEQNLALEEVNLREANKKAEVELQRNIVKGIENQYGNVVTLVNAMRKDTTISQRSNPNDTSHPARFTKEHIKELDSFIREETFSDSVYEEHSLEELWVDGHKVLERISQPSIQFSLGVVDFLNIVEAQHVWSRFVLGDTVRLYQKELNFDYQVRMVGYTHSPDSNQLTLKFSTTDSMDDASLYLRDILDSMKSTTSAVNFSRFKWDKGDQAQSAISQYIDSNLDLAKQKLIAADSEDSQRVLIDSRGYWGQKINPDGITYSPKQLRMLNDVIAMTRNNWKTVDIAISPDMGINASLINGKIGNFATINSHQINVGGFEDNDGLDEALEKLLAQHNERVELTEGQIIRITIKLNALQSRITNLFIAGALSEEHLNELALLIEGLEEEKIALNTHYYALLSEPNLTGSQKQAYIDAKVEYDNSHTNLVDLLNSSVEDKSISAEEKGLLDSAFQATRAKLTDFKDAFTVASQFVAEKSAAQISHFLIVDFDIEPLLPRPTDPPQTDNRIDYWFYREVPTLTNPPASNWTLAQTKTDHLGDLYYHMDTKVTYRFVVSAGVYSWQIVEDPKVMESMERASVTKATFDRKFSIFLSQPIPPYQIGDLWKKGNLATELDVCIEPLISGAFDPTHWTNAVNLETVLKQFQSEIDDFSSDLILTRAEANSLRTTLDALLAESYELLGTAGSLLIPDEPERTMDLQTVRDEYQAAIILLENFLNDNWLGQTYPLEVTIQEREVVKTLLDDVETKKTELITEISLQLTLQNAVIVGEVYNGISINKVDGLKVYTTDGMMQSFFNATGGILMQKNTGTKNGPVWEDVFVVDTQGNLSVTGNINMTSGNINWSEVPGGYDDAQALAAWVASGYKTYIDGNGLYTGTVAAKRILMDAENGYISFTDLSNQPDIPNIALTTWEDSPYKTYIDGNGIYTGTLNANQVTVGILNKDRIDVAGLNLLQNPTFASYAADTSGNTSAIQQNASAIVLAAGDIAAANAQITLNKNEIATTVSNITTIGNTVTQHTASITTNAQNITLAASEITTINGKVSTNSANITINANAITSNVNRIDTAILNERDARTGAISSLTNVVTTNNSNINQRADAITANVNSLDTRQTTNYNTLTGQISSLSTTVTNNKSSLDIRANQIESNVSSVVNQVNTNYNQQSGQISSINSTVNTFDSRITQNANSITSKVSKTDYTGASIVSLIEQTSSSIKLSATKIHLNGITNVNKTLTLGSGADLGSLTFANGASIYATPHNVGVTLNVSAADIWMTGRVFINGTEIGGTSGSTVKFG